MGLFSFTNIAVSIVSLLVARRLYWEITTGSRQRAFAKQHGCLLPKPRPTKKIVFGLDYVMRNVNAVKQHCLLEAWTQDFKDINAHTIITHILGQTIFETDDPENIKAVLSTNFDAWSLGKARIEQMSSYLGNGIFTTEGAAWKHSRDMLRPCFEKSQVADVSMFEAHTAHLLDLLPMDGTTIDLQPLFYDLALDIATEFLFGKSTNALLDRDGKDTVRQEFIKAFEYCQNPFQSENSKLGILALFLPDRKFNRSAKMIQDFAENIITEELALKSESSKEASPSSRYIFLDEMLSMTQDRTVIRAELLNILLAGRDTTAALLSNLFWELSRQPEVLARLRREIVDAVGDEVPTYQQLKEMKYLKAILNESQRLYPIVPSNSREALKDTTLPRGGGPDGTAPVFVPKGAHIAYHPYVMHRRTDIFGPDTDKFDPTRWLDDESSSPPLRPGWGYVPFSGGPRVCIGQNFALTEVMFVTVRMLQVCEIEGRDGEPWKEKMSIVCTGLGGCKVGLKPVKW